MFAVPCETYQAPTPNSPVKISKIPAANQSACNLLSISPLSNSRKNHTERPIKTTKTPPLIGKCSTATLKAPFKMTVNTPNIPMKAKSTQTRPVNTSATNKALKTLFLACTVAARVCCSAFAWLRRFSISAADVSAFSSVACNWEVKILFCSMSVVA